MTDNDFGVNTDSQSYLYWAEMAGPLYHRLAKHQTEEAPGRARAHSRCFSEMQVDPERAETQKELHTLKSFLEEETGWRLSYLHRRVTAEHGARGKEMRLSRKILGGRVQK